MPIFEVREDGTVMANPKFERDPNARTSYIGPDGLRVAENGPGTPDFQQRKDIAAKLI